VPSKSQRQHNYFAMLSHDPAKARAEGVSQKVARDFTQADKGRKFGKRGRKMKRKSGRK
jgi:hypothetical protein